MFVRKPVFALGIETASFYAGVHHKRYNDSPVRRGGNAQIKIRLIFINRILELFSGEIRN